MRSNFGGLVLALLAVGCTEGMVPDPDAGFDELADEDGDWIADAEEARRESRDTDGDGIPDFEDLDSDGDTIPDLREAGDMDLTTPPIDSDLDGRPDYLDLDSDGNGLPDIEEGVGDYDGDAIEDYADLDDDDDTVSDEREIAHVFPPIDTDGDGRPNFRDNDSDNDVIFDGDEFGPDTDLDGLFDQEDLDTDGDGIPDFWEAGDDDLFSAPIDTDGDLTPDFRDLDSDGDFLPDRDEDRLGTDPRNVDTDGDGVSDYLENAAGSDPLDETESPLSRGDFVFVVPYEMPPVPDRDTLEFRTNVQFADVYFIFDISGSMRPTLSAVRTVATDVLNELTCTDFGVACEADAGCGPGRVCSVEGRCVGDPAISGCIPSLWSGTGVFSNSCAGCHRYRNDRSIQPDPVMTRDAMPTDIMGGAEDHFRTLSCIADPSLCDSETMCSRTGIGCPGFREEAIRMVIMFSDEDDECTAGQCVGLDTASIAGSYLSDADIFFVGVNTAPSGPEHDATQAQFEEIGIQSGSLDGRGLPVVFGAPSGDPSMLGATVASAVRLVTQGVPRNVTAEPEDIDIGAIRFIDRLEVNTSGVGFCTAVAPTTDTDGDGFDDTFPSLLSGTRVCWDVVARPNDFLPPTDDPQIFQARIVVRGDGSVLDTRSVWFLVPSERDHMGPD